MEGKESKRESERKGKKENERKGKEKVGKLKELGKERKEKGEMK